MELMERRSNELGYSQEKPNSIVDKIPKVCKGSGKPPQAVIEVLFVRASSLGLKRNFDTTIGISGGFLGIAFRHYCTNMSG
jgi:hypothetical protein